MIAIPEAESPLMSKYCWCCLYYCLCGAYQAWAAGSLFSHVKKYFVTLSTKPLCTVLFPFSSNWNHACPESTVCTSLALWHRQGLGLAGEQCHPLLLCQQENGGAIWSIVMEKGQLTSQGCWPWRQERYLFDNRSQCKLYAPVRLSYIIWAAWT